MSNYSQRWKDKTPRSIHEEGNHVVPRRFTPEPCRKSGCPIAVVRDRNGMVVWHDNDRMDVPQDHLGKPDSNIWGEDIQPWLEQRHANPSTT